MVRHRGVRRGAAGERGLKGGAPVDAVRPALEAALAVARVGLAEQPPVPPPRLLRPLLAHTRLTTAALRTIARTLDEDGEFRARVLAAVDAIDGEDSPRASWLFLARPDGWAEELDALAQARDDDAAVRREEQEERSSLRRLDRAEEATRRAEEAARRADDKARAAATDLASERDARRASEDSADAFRRRVTALESERDAARRKAEDAAALRTRVADLEAELAATVDVDTLDRAVVAATEAVATLTMALDTARGEVDRVRPRVVDAAEEPAESTVPGHRPRTPSAPRRSPAALPPAVFEDSPEAARHLVRVNGVVLLVDGYNASKSYRPDLPAADQRQRLVDALTELAARTGADVHVVFDGADIQDGDRPVASARSLVKVAFSPRGVEADDVILSRIGGIPMHRPVVVASSDRRVQDGARAQGANVLSSPQLLEVLDRTPG